jgi:hypothetical protein
MNGLFVGIFNTLSNVFNEYLKAPLLYALILGIVYIFVTSFFGYIQDKLPSVIDIQSYIDMLPDSIHYYFKLFRVDTGLVIMLSALAIRFTIRRIPGVN